MKIVNLLIMQSFGSLMLSWCFNVTNRQMSNYFLHVLVDKEWIETGLVYQKKNGEIIM